MTIKPQEGFQEMALSTPADIAILGGSAGGGKSFVLLLEGARNTNNPRFNGVIFRRTSPQIKNSGSLWDTSFELYPYLQAQPAESALRWTFPRGATIKFSHMEYEKNMYDWMGSQIPFIGFDELTHFTEEMFFYMLSRNRSMCGVRPYVRASCNPDPDSWVAKFIAWWIDQETGFPIKERIGKLRYMVRKGDDIFWGDTWQEVYDLCPDLFNNKDLIDSGVDPKDLIKSVTFIPGNIYDNKLLIKKDPGYLGNLLALPDAERKKLLEGNWKIRLDGLGLFNYDAIAHVFENYKNTNPKARRCITCDAARFGRDLCVIMVWHGWEVVYMVVYKKSDVLTIVGKIEQLRERFKIIKLDVVVDQDGVGGDTVKLGAYRGFHGGHPAKKDPDTHKVENYKNFKTQCFYRVSKRLNVGEIQLSIHDGTCEIYDTGETSVKMSTRIMMGQKVKSVLDLIKEDLKAIKRANVDMEGKLQINTKDEQKQLLGRSPDFADTIMMRESLEMAPKSQTMKTLN